MAKGSFAFPQATARAQALGEIHARPYALVPSPRVIFQLAFLMGFKNFINGNATLCCLYSPVLSQFQDSAAGNTA